jgi:hypothetical protein
MHGGWRILRRTLHTCWIGSCKNGWRRELHEKMMEFFGLLTTRPIEPAGRRLGAKAPCNCGPVARATGIEHTKTQHMPACSNTHARPPSPSDTIREERSNTRARSICALYVASSEEQTQRDADEEQEGNQAAPHGRTTCIHQYS